MQASPNPVRCSTPWGLPHFALLYSWHHILVSGFQGHPYTERASQVALGDLEPPEGWGQLDAVIQTEVDACQHLTYIFGAMTSGRCLGFRHTLSLLFNRALKQRGLRQSSL